MAGSIDGGSARGSSAIGALWALVVIGGVLLMWALTQWGLAADVPTSEFATIAIGTGNAVGIVSFGGWNSVGIVAFGGTNSVGVVAVGGVNSIGLITFGGLNSIGAYSYGGLNSVPFVSGYTILQWNPIRRQARRDS